jgi:DNA polymerase-4
MDACQKVTPASLESSGLHGLQILFDALEPSSQRLKPDRRVGTYGTTEVVPSQPVVEEKRWWVQAIWYELGKVRAAKRATHIVHVEVDELFASVEQVLSSKLRGKPVLVGRSVVASASREAKLHGVKTGMSLIDAVRLCPKAIVVPGQYEHYAEFAERVRQILETYAPVVETAALNDFHLEFAGSGRRCADFAGTLRRLQEEVLGRTGLNVSVGAGRTKVVASIASRLAGPHGVRIVAPGTEETFLAPLPLDRLYGNGHAHAVALAQQGVTTIGALRRIPRKVLAAAFGDEGRQIWAAARGLDERQSSLPSACVLRETSIAVGTVDREVLGGLLEYLSERIGAALREQGKQAGSIGVRVRYVDQSSARQTIRLVCPTNDARELLVAARELFAKLAARGVAVGQVGASVANLADERRPDEILHPEASRGWIANREMSRTDGCYGWDAVLQSSKIFSSPVHG